MRPILFEIGPLTVYSYGVFVVLGFAVGAAVTYYLAKRAKLPAHRLVDYALYGTLAGLVGARIWYLLFRPDEAGGFFHWFAIGGGGLALPGGILLGGIVVVLLLRRQKQPIWKWFDVIAIGALAGLAVGKLGSFLNGDSLGTGTGLPWGVTYERPALAAEGEAVHPLPIYQSIAYAAIAVYAYRLWALARDAKPGLVFWTVLFLLSAVLIVSELWHASADALTLPGGTRAVIPAALILLVASCYVLFTKYRVAPSRPGRKGRRR